MLSEPAGFSGYGQLSAQVSMPKGADTLSSLLVIFMLTTHWPKASHMAEANISGVGK